MATALDNIPVVQNSSPSDQLKALIHAGSLLAGNSKGRGDDASKTLQDIAISRLHEFNSVTSQIPNLALSLDEINEKDLGELKSLTAQKSLGILEHIQALLREHDVDLPADNRESNSPQIALGTRDLTVLRTLASVVFGWGTTPLLVALYPQVGSLSTGNLPDKSILIPEINLLTVRLVSLIWPSDGGAGTSSQSTRPFPSHITKILTTSHVVDILRLGISIGWLPEPDNQMQEMVYKLLKMLPASQAIVSLGSVSQPIRASPESGPLSLPAPPYLQKVTSGLLSQQVLRPDGVSGLCAAVFGEADEVAPLVKLERIARVLGAVPSHMNREVYMRTIIPNIITLLSPPKLEFQSQSVPTSYRQAAAFTLSRLFKISKSLTLKIASPMIHGRFFYEPTPSLETPSLSDTITTLTTLFTSTDPSPFLAQVVIEPILVPLYNLLAHLDAQRISDPTLKELARGLIKTWARLVGREEAVEGLWSVIQGTGGWGVGGEAKWCWDVAEEGLEISKTGPPKPIPLSVLQGPDDNGELGDEEDDNPLSLRPAPTHFGELLKSLERKDVASAIFVKTLNAYQASKVMDTDPLKKPEYLAQDPLRIVEADSDDEDRVDEPQAEDEMVLTAVTLLLALLEANEKMSTLTSPLLAVIFDYIEPITNHNDESLRSLAREARLVLISRRSIAEVGPLATDAGRPALQTYQEALRLIQDPILPVRAHGLHMLRQLVVPPKPAKGTPPIAPPELNAALIPAILDVFLQSIQEEDSFVFLNAVQGLSTMANRLGREIIQNLVRIYADGVESGHPIERAEMDKRVRVGEALVQVVRSCGDALGNYVDMLVPSLFRVIRAHNLPTILRSSALSILSQCVETSPVSVTGWTEDILSGMLDILQLESVQAVPLSRKAREEARQKEETKFDLSVDSNPQEVDSKLPPLRRSALVCFALVVRSMVEGVYEDTRPAQLGNLRSKAITVLEYVRLTDSDSVTRTQAAETLSLVKQLGRAELGLDVFNHPSQTADISSVIMQPSSPPASAPVEKRKKKKSKKHTPDVSSPSVGGATSVTTNSVINTEDGINRAIQTALDHATAIATPSSTNGPSTTQERSSKPKKRHATSNDPIADGSEPRKSKKQKSSDNSVASSSPIMSPPTANPTNVTPNPNTAHLVSAYIPPQLGHSHIPIDPTLTGHEHLMQQHPHLQAIVPNATFTGNALAAANGASQHHPDALGSFIFNQDADLSSLGSNEELIRALQGFDLSKFAGVFKYPESMSTENPAPVHQGNEPGPSRLGNNPQLNIDQPVAVSSGASGNKPRQKKIVAPQPGSQIVNPEHADILATHWLNPAKLAELVKEQGLVYKKGKFSAIEEHQIEEALQNYAKSRSLTPPEIDAIIFSKGKKAKEEYSTFWSEITRAVPQRPIIAVYHHVRRTHHPMKQQGKWTPEEDAIVIAAVAELGQKWEQISLRVGRMSSDCRDRYRNHLVDQEARVVGPWTKEEEDELTRIVMELTVERGLQADNDVLWSEVSERMGGRRTRQQVRIKWTDALNKRVKNAGERPRWSAQDAYILVHKVASMPVQDDTEIDWKLLPDPQWNLWSAHQLQRRWFGLKKTLKDSDTMPHSEIISILQSKFRDPPEQPNAPRRYETKKSRNAAIGREFITDEDDNFEDFGDPSSTHDLFSQTADGNPIDPELVRAAQQQLEAVLEIASQQAAASGSGSQDA
ncbi:Required for nuclear transport of RNA pol II C-terminus 1 [Rhizoctonia solani]|uniref:Required for nuclear transport of RNA pol II C-terminus 1 n=1 Tax=Rhizoctonia solani TaxID=456999 RepID=A0A8H7HBE2_9AGAM|nr:Required for nuclear transport of RNA pol II C-terminus 1 [Rhizoctonia solani]